MKKFDAHFHIIDFDFPITENEGYMPPSYLVEDYVRDTASLHIQGGALVSGSFQRYDQQYLVKALERLGPTYCGVTQLPYDVTDEALLRLNGAGVRAIRFNVHRGGSEDLSKLDYFARRVYEVAGWHSELYIDARHLPEMTQIVAALPAVSVDHLGLSIEGLPHLLNLVDKGIKVKASGFGRVELDVAHALKAINEVNPEALMFGTDLPSTRAKRPFHVNDVTLIETLFDAKTAQRIFYDNAYKFYFGRR